MFGGTVGRWGMGALALLAVVVAGVLSVQTVRAEDEETPVPRVYPHFPPAPAEQTPEQARAKSVGCMSCHTDTDSMTMHVSPAVVIGCTDCHGGDANPAITPGLSKDDPAYAEVRDTAHVLPRYPKRWH